MKRKYIILILSFFIFLFLFRFIIIPTDNNINNNIQTSQDSETKSDIDYIFNENLLYKNDNKYDAFKYYNIKNRTEMLGNYPATFSFEDNNIGQFPIGWEFIQESDKKSSITNHKGHEKVLCLSDTKNDEYIQVKKEINLGIENSIDFWILTNNITSKIHIFLGTNISNCIFLLFRETGYISYFDTSYHNLMFYQINTWYHFKIQYNFYTDFFDLWINSIKIGTDLELRGNPNMMDYIIFSTGTVEIFKVFIDAIDLGNDCGYYRHRNLISKNEYIESKSNGNYEATHSFFDDIIGETPKGWTVVEGAVHPCTIIEELDNHKKVLELRDQSVVTSCYIYRPIVQKRNQILEFWIGKSSILEMEDFHIQFYESDFHPYYENEILILNLSVKNNDFKYYKESWYTIKDNFFIPNTFFHIKIVLNDIENTFNCYINGILELLNGNYCNNVDISINKIKLITSFSGSLYQCYFDGFGLSSDSDYIIGSNYYSQKDDILNKWEFDKYEFNYIENEFEYNSYLWKQYEHEEENWIYIDFKNDTYSNLMYHSATQLGVGIGDYRQGLCFEKNMNYNSFNFTFNFKYDLWNDYGTLISWKFYSYTSDLELIPFIFAINTTLDIANPLQNRDWLKPIMFFYPHNFSWEFTGIYVGTDREMSLNFYINYNDNIAILSTHNVSKVLPIEINGFWENLYGFSKLNITTHNTVSGNIEHMRGYWKNIGIYHNGISYKENYMNKREYSLIIYNLSYNDNWNVWITKFYNLLNITLESDCIFYMSTSYYNFLSTGVIIKERDYIDKNRIYNLYKDYKYAIHTPYLIIMLYNNFSLIDYLSISGVKITTTIDKIENYYYPDYYWSKWYDIDFNFNSYYYYVKNNKLYYYIHNLDIDDYFKIVFKVNYKDVSNYTLKFRSHIINNYTGQLLFRYSWYGLAGYTTYDISETVLPIQLSYTLPNKSLRYIEININNYHNNSYNISDGYISSLLLIIDILSFDIIEFMEYETITEGLLFILTRLLFIFLPTFIFYSKLGKKYVIPLFLLMSIISVIAGLIPLWILFIIFFGSGLFLINERSEN